MSRNSKTRKRKRRKARKDRQEDPRVHEFIEATEGPEWPWAEDDGHENVKGRIFDLFRIPAHLIGVDYATGPVRTVETTGHMEGGEFRVDSFRDLEDPNDFQE